MTRFTFPKDGDGVARRPWPRKSSVLHWIHGQRVRLETPGGGGYGDPLGARPRRDPAPTCELGLRHRRGCLAAIMGVQRRWLDADMTEQLGGRADMAAIIKPSSASMSAAPSPMSSSGTRLGRTPCTSPRFPRPRATSRSGLHRWCEPADRDDFRTDRHGCSTAPPSAPTRCWNARVRARPASSPRRAFAMCWKCAAATGPGPGACGACSSRLCRDTCAGGRRAGAGGRHHAHPGGSAGSGKVPRKNYPTPGCAVGLRVFREFLCQRRQRKAAVEAVRSMWPNDHMSQRRRKSCPKSASSNAPRRQR